MNNWIRVRDKLPEVDETVIAYCRFGNDPANTFMSLAYVDAHGAWAEWPTSRNANVTHWMPLPDPPNKLWVWTPNEYTTCTCGEELALPHDRQRVECPCGEVWINLGEDEAVIDGYTKELRLYYKWRTE